jgi:hypothetical protein
MKIDRSSTGGSRGLNRIGQVRWRQTRWPTLTDRWRKRRRRAALLLGLLLCAGLAIATVAWATETLTTQVRFNPDKLGVPTNASVTARFHTTEGGVPSPVSKVTAYLPAGMKIDVRGAGTCDAAKLQAVGPSACPADSRIGFGGGTGLLELAKEVIQEPYTLDLFLGPEQDGHLVVLAYVDAVSPASFQIVVVAKEFHAPKPYGLGFTFEVPPIPTLPEASNASIESAFLTVGDKNVAYYKRLAGKRKLVHVNGIVVPKTCPSGGFPYKALVSFEDGTSLTNTGAIPCPHR